MKVAQMVIRAKRECVSNIQRRVSKKMPEAGTSKRCVIHGLRGSRECPATQLDRIAIAVVGGYVERAIAFHVDETAAERLETTVAVRRVICGRRGRRTRNAVRDNRSARVGLRLCRDIRAFALLDEPEVPGQRLRRVLHRRALRDDDMQLASCCLAAILELPNRKVCSRHRLCEPYTVVAVWRIVDEFVCFCLVGAVPDFARMLVQPRPHRQIVLARGKSGIIVRTVDFPVCRPSVNVVARCQTIGINKCCTPKIVVYGER